MTNNHDMVHAPRASIAALEFTDEQRAMIRDTYAPGANSDEFAVLMEIARTRRLNPLLRQIHFVSRWDAEKRRSVWAPQVSIDGLRAIAERTGLYQGQDEPEFIDNPDGTPKLCKVRVYRRDWPRPAVGIAYWVEYVQTYRDKTSGAQVVAPMWRKMPHVMLAKVAESIAIRKAFPEDMSGLYAPEEMAQASNDDAPHALEVTRTQPKALPPPTEGISMARVAKAALAMGLDREAGEEARIEREAIQSECEPAPEGSPLGRLSTGLTAVENIADSTKLWRELAWGLNDAGQTTEGRRLVGEHLAARGYPLTAAALTTVLAGTVTDALRAVYDGVAVLSLVNPVEDAAAVLRDLREQLTTHERTEATRAAVRRLEALGIEGAKAKLAAILSPKGDGPKGGAKPKVAQNTEAKGEGTEATAGDAPSALVTPELIAWREHLAAKKHRGEDNGAGEVAGSWWKHKEREIAGWSKAVQSLAYSSVLDELEARGIAEAHAWLQEIGEKNGYIVRRAA